MNLEGRVLLKVLLDYTSLTLIQPGTWPFRAFKMVILNILTVAARQKLKKNNTI